MPIGPQMTEIGYPEGWSKAMIERMFASYILIPGKWYIILAVVVATSTGVLLETLSEKRVNPC